MPAANLELVKMLEDLVALAKTGEVTNAVAVAFGERTYTYRFAVPHADDMVRAVGEVDILKTEMKELIRAERARQLANTPAIVRPGLIRN